MFDGNTEREYQEKRNFIIQSVVSDLERQKESMEEVEKHIENMLEIFGMKLTAFPGVSNAIASKLIAEIGDIRRFSSADKLAKFCGIAPVRFSSAGKGKDRSSRQGNRVLHGLFYFLAVSTVCVTKGGKPNQPIFYEYYQKKLNEGKTKSQALVCIMLRLVSIIYGMMKNKTEYIAPITENEQ